MNDINYFYKLFQITYNTNWNPVIIIMQHHTWKIGWLKSLGYEQKIQHDYNMKYPGHQWKVTWFSLYFLTKHIVIKCKNKIKRRKPQLKDDHTVTIKNKEFSRSLKSFLIYFYFHKQLILIIAFEWHNQENRNITKQDLEYLMDIDFPLKCVIFLDHRTYLSIVLENVGPRLSILYMPTQYSTECFSSSNNTIERDQDNANRKEKIQVIWSYTKLP